MVTIIAAIAKNNVIGIKGKLPWDIKEDLAHFKKLTMGYPCIMSRVTYSSIPERHRPLEGRLTIILTKNKRYHAPVALVLNNFKQAISICRCSPKSFIVGGASIYALGLEVADTLEITHIDQDYEGDVLFPDIDYSKYIVISERKMCAIDQKTGLSVGLRFTTYNKNPKKDERKLLYPVSYVFSLAASSFL